MTKRNNNVSELYHNVAAKLGDAAFFSSSILSMDRSESAGPVKVLVQTPLGRKIILAKKLVSTISHKMGFLTGYDLSSSERSLFRNSFTAPFTQGFFATLLYLRVPHSTPSDSVDPTVFPISQAYMH